MTIEDKTTKPVQCVFKDTEKIEAIKKITDQEGIHLLTAFRKIRAIINEKEQA